MEEVIILILQVFFEIFFNAIISLPFDWFFSSLHTEQQQQNFKGCIYPIIFLAAGAGCGWLSLMLLPKLLIAFPALRLVNLIFAPLMAGGMAVYLAAKRNQNENKIDSTLHFFNSFFFTFAFVAVRWAYSR